MSKFEILESEKGIIKSWTKGVFFEEQAKEQLRNVASLPFIHKWVSVMPDVHKGYGATVGSVIPTVGAVVPSAVGVDIGCGMMAVQTSLKAEDLPDSLKKIRSDFESVIPVGFSCHEKDLSTPVIDKLACLYTSGYSKIIEKTPSLKHDKVYKQMGTLGGGNHFVELCLDEKEMVWIMLHSGSRGVGNKIGRHFIELAKKDMERYFIHLPDKDLAYLPEGSEHYEDYIFAVDWAQEYARANREAMMVEAISALRSNFKRDITVINSAINCHHNYISKENHYGKNIHVTRKGAVRARKGDLGIIPGSMGAKSFIVEGLGNEESFCSCSHGAGRVMSRTQARREISLEEHIEATKGVECRKDINVIDESPKAYKDIDKVMEAQSDLVKIKHTLKQVMCIKG